MFRSSHTYRVLVNSLKIIIIETQTNKSKLYLRNEKNKGCIVVPTHVDVTKLIRRRIIIISNCNRSSCKNGSWNLLIHINVIRFFFWFCLILMVESKMKSSLTQICHKLTYKQNYIFQIPSVPLKDMFYSNDLTMYILKYHLDQNSITNR